MAWNKTQEAAFKALAELGGELSREEDVVFRGTQYVLPEKAENEEKAAKFLLQRAKDQNTKTRFSREYKYRSHDGAHAVAQAIRLTFGFSVSKPIVTFFGVQPPQMISIRTGINTQEQVPWGALTLPGLEETTLYLGEYFHRELGQCFSIIVEAPRKYRDIIEGFFNAVQRQLEEKSIYRGKAIDGALEPNFIDTASVDRENIIYSEDVVAQLQANVWSPIIHESTLRRLKQPGKRSVLLEGPYGSGKTLAALLTAQIAEEHGWTFIMCRPGVDDFFLTLQTARMYEPAVVFLEDVDRVSDPTEDQDSVSRVLDAFDGLRAKGMRLLLALTTNHVEKIHKGMIRPGRLDSIIHIGAMDRPGVELLTKRIVGKALAEKVDYDQVYQATEGFMPAFVKEALDRAIRYSVVRSGGTLGLIDTEDLVLAANGLRRQLELMNDAQDTTPRDSLGTLMGRMIDAKVSEALNRTVGGMNGKQGFELWTVNEQGQREQVTQ